MAAAEKAAGAVLRLLASRLRPPSLPSVSASLARAPRVAFRSAAAAPALGPVRAAWQAARAVGGRAHTAATPSGAGFSSWSIGQLSVGQLCAVAWLWPAETEEERRRRLERREKRRAERQRLREATQRDRIERKRLLAEQRERQRMERHQARLMERERRETVRREEMERREHARRELQERMEREEKQATTMKGVAEMAEKVGAAGEGDRTEPGTDPRTAKVDADPQAKPTAKGKIHEDAVVEMKDAPSISAAVAAAHQEKYMGKYVPQVVRPKSNNFWGKVFFNVLAVAFLIMAAILMNSDFDLPKV